MNKKTILNFLPMCKSFIPKFLVAFVFIIISVVFSYLTPQIIRITVDSVIDNKPFALPSFFVEIIENAGGREFLVQNVLYVAFFAFSLSLLASVCDFISRLFLSRASEGSLELIRNKLFEHIQKLPYSWHNKHQTGDIIQRCTMDVDILRTFLNDHLHGLTRVISLMVIAFVIMFSMNVTLSIVSLVFIPITLIYSFVFYVIIGKKFQQADECEGELSSIVQENLTAVRVVRAFGREKFEVDKFNAKNDEFAKLWVKLGKVMGLNWGSGDFLSFIQVVTIIGLGTFLAVEGVITTGEFLIFILYNNMLIWPIRNLGRILSELSKTTISSQRLFDILDATPEKSDENGVQTDMKGDIEFKNVVFGYSDFATAVDGISFKIEGGKTLGILGATGSGKSTLMYLLDRLYEPDSGEILIGGVNISEMSLDYLRKNIGLVLQEPFLFSKSFKESISDGSMHNNLETVRKYAKMAVIDDTIVGFSEGYDTHIGERGVTISGGQKQRVAIARMLMQDTPIKIFDDSLSAVDMETDAKIRESINSNVKGTTIIITHRITTIKNADLIIVMDKGKIVATGNHESLCREEGIYKRIYDNQNFKN